jgi:hypothetical protein
MFYRWPYGHWSMNKMQVHKQVIKDLGRIPDWKRGILGKTPACEQEHLLIPNDSVRIPAWDRVNPGKLQASQGKHIPG